MKRLALLYLAAVLVTVGLITGTPWRLLPGTGEMAAAPQPEPPPQSGGAAAGMPVSDAPQSEATGAAASGAGAAAALAAAVAASTEPAAPAGPKAQPIVRSGKASLEQTTAAILAELAIVTEEGDTGDDLFQMSSAALTDLRGALGQTGSTALTLEHLVADALKSGQSDAAIDALVNEAAGTGTVSVPAELVTPEGRVDTAVLLANLVTQAEIAAGLVAPVDPSTVVAGGAGVESHLVTKVGGGAETARFYTVGPGDSLGAIALKFYGDVIYYPQIFEANRAILASPDRLTVGQRLTIPSVAGL